MSGKETSGQRTPYRADQTLGGGQEVPQPPGSAGDHQGSSGSGAPQGPRRAGGGLLVVLVALMGVAPLFTLALSSSAALIVERLGISAGQLGIVAAVVFGSAAVSALSLGRMADKVSPQIQLIINFSGTAIALVAAAFTTSFWVLILAGILSGSTQAISNPTTNRVILEILPVEKRPGWIGIKQSGVQAAQLFSGIFFPAVAMWLGWTGAALGGSAIAVFLTVYGLWVLARYYQQNRPRIEEREPGAAKSGPAAEPPSPASSSASTAAGQGAHPGPDGNPAAPAGEKVPAPPVGKQRLPGSVAILAVVAFLMGFSAQATNVYLPLFSVEQLGFSLLVGGMTATVCGVVGVISRIWWARRVSAGMRLSTLLLVMSAGALGGVGLLLAAQATGLGMFVWVAAALHGMTALGANVVVNAGVMRGAPPGQIGRASGISAMGMYAGFTAGPLTVGWLRDLTGDFMLSWTVVGLSFIIAVVTALVLRRYRSPASEGQGREQPW